VGRGKARDAAEPAGCVARSLQIATGRLAACSPPADLGPTAKRQVILARALGPHVRYGATIMAGFDFTDPGFWLALLVGLISVACFLYWLITGGRKR